ncbi:MAG: hypothetical protein ABI616_02665 [Pseudomonadota bacterium]
MRPILRSQLAGAILIFTGIATAGDVSPFIGIWNLNLARSTFNQGAPPKSIQRVYVPAGNAVEMTVSNVGADGKPFTVHSTFTVDGKDAVASGVDFFDNISVERIDSSHFVFTLKKAGKSVGIVDTMFSVDGKEFTQVVKGITSGAAATSSQVFERQ